VSTAGYSPEPNCDIASLVGSASEGKKGPEPHSEPALAEPTPAFAAVEVRHQHGKDLVRIEGVRGSSPSERDLRARHLAPHL
jgi:hypothetical protein